MGNLNVAVIGAKGLAGEVGKKGTVTDMTFYDYKSGTDSFTLIEPSKYPEKLSSLFYSVAMSEFAILVVDSIDSFLGETIVMTDSKGKRDAADVQAYTLTKVKPKVASDFAGRYRLSGDAAANGYTGVLTIAGTAQDGVTVDISADGVEEGCTFNAHGKVINDQIEIPLQSANPGMNSTLVIRSDVPDVMNVSTSNAGDSEDMALFCSGGKTLAGDYVKAH